MKGTAMAIKVSKKKRLARALTQRLLKPNAISDLRNKFEAEKRHLIFLLINLTPDSLPLDFCEFLKVALSTLISDGKYRRNFEANHFGFSNIHEFKRQIRLLKEAWKDRVKIIVGDPINSSYWCTLEFLPA